MSERMKRKIRQAKYVKIPGIISPELAAVCAKYAKANEEFRFTGGDPQAPDSHSVYGDFLTESLLESLTEVVEEETGLSLWPSHSFYRVYRPHFAPNSSPVR